MVVVQARPCRQANRRPKRCVATAVVKCQWGTSVTVFSLKIAVLLLDEMG